MCAARKEWAARRTEYKKFEEYGGDMPIVNGWPYDLKTLEDLILNVAQPTAGAITECGKPMEFRNWPKHWGPLPRLFMLCGTNPVAWHPKYVVGTCDALGIKMPDSATGKKRTDIYYNTYQQP